MRIALLTGEYPPLPGGVGDYTRRLGGALGARGHAVCVLTIDDSRFTIHDLSQQGSVRASSIVSTKSSWGWHAWRDVVAALDQARPDVLHIQYQTGAYAMRPAVNLLPWRLRGLPRRPAVAVTAHDLLLPYLFPKAGPLRRWVTYRLLADADAVVVTNQADFAQLADKRPITNGERLANVAGYSSSFLLRSSSIRNLDIIPIGSNISATPPAGFDRAKWRAGLSAAQGQTLVAYFGLISRTKGLDTLLAALARLPEQYRLLVVGGAASPPEDRAFAAEIARMTAGLGLEGRVTITGHCPEPQVAAHLLAADLAALPFADGASFRRGSLLAALAHGVPTITTTPTTDDRRPTTNLSGVGRWSVVSGRLANGENVLLVPPGDEQALAGAIERLANDTALRARLAEGGRRLAAQFSWEEIAARHEELYTRMLCR
jgi:glycosyltransferase involved in cell wall biosynthesis